MKDFTHFKFFKTARQAASFIRKYGFGTLQKVGSDGFNETVKVLMEQYGYPEPSSEDKAVVIWTADPIFIPWD